MTLHVPLPVRARSPGKLILSGEHSVSYGRPAVAAAVARHAVATVWPGEGEGWSLHFPLLGPTRRIRPEDLQALKQRVELRHEDFLLGRLAIGDVLGGPAEFADYVLAVAHTAFGGLGGALRMEVESAIPLGSGMGSSAAVALSMLAGLAAAAGEAPSLDALYALAMAPERVQHGRPSGVDVHLCLHGGVARFEGGRASPMAVDIPPLTLVHTGRPLSSTGECVAAVREQFARDDARWDAFAAVTAQVVTAMRQRDRGAFAEAVRENERLLEGIGVVPEPVQAFIRAVEARGGSAKVCGAGSVRGPGGGMVMLLGEGDWPPLVAQFGYHMLHGELDAHGTTVF